MFSKGRDPERQEGINSFYRFRMVGGPFCYGPFDAFQAPKKSAEQALSNKAQVGQAQVAGPSRASQGSVLSILCTLQHRPESSWQWAK